VLTVCGGDGSLGCFIDLLIEDPLIASNLGRLYFTAMPFGTGNDISRSLGWGSSEGRLAYDLNHLALSLIEGKREKFALWEVEEFAEETQGYSKN